MGSGNSGRNFEPIKAGSVKRMTDEDVKSLVLELLSINIANTYITCPCDPKQTLGIRLPFIVIIVKNLEKFFSFEIQILDDRNVKRRFKISNYASSTKVLPFACTMPIGLNPGWNQIQFNLVDFTRRAYGTTYIETCRIQVNANCRLRRIYFSNKIYLDDELPKEYKLYQPKSKSKQEVTEGGGAAEAPPAGTEQSKPKIENWAK